MAQYSFTSTETRRLVRTDSPRTATSTVIQLLNYETSVPLPRPSMSATVEAGSGHGGSLGRRNFCELEGRLVPGAAGLILRLADTV